MPKKSKAADDKTNPRVDEFLLKATRWKKEFAKLREICLACEVTEELKWGNPCYMVEKKNVVLMHGFKDYCALLFFKGVLLPDPKKLLVQQTENVQGPRQIRFRNVAEITKLAPVVRAYINEAIKVEKSGLKVTLKKTSEFEAPEEFQARLDKDAAVRKAFNALTPGRQRQYLLYFSSAKLSKTRESRIEKCVPRILDGLGIDD